MSRATTEARETICTVTFAKRADGGMRIFSDDLPGLILSHSDPDKVAADVWPTIKVLIERGAYRRPAPPMGEVVAWRCRLSPNGDWFNLEPEYVANRIADGLEVQPLYALAQPGSDGAGEGFERFPQLAWHIERMASTGATGSLVQWGDFIHSLNKALATIREGGEGK